MPGAVSILPAFPLFPIMAWGAAYFLDLAIEPLGTYAIAALHGVLLLVVTAAIIRFIRIIQRRSANELLQQQKASIQACTTARHEPANSPAAGTE